MRWLIMGLLVLLLVACGGEDEADVNGGEAPAAERSETVTAQEPTAVLAEASATTVSVVTETVATLPTPTTASDSTATSVGSEEPAATATPEPEPTQESDVPFDPAAVSIVLEPVITSLAAPVGLVAPGDGSGRLFVVEKVGRIQLLQDGQLAPTPFLDISDLVSGGYEQGLLGLAFEPGRPERFYINYTNRAGHTVIARYLAAPDGLTADRASEEVLLFIEQPAPNHNGGHLLFGPDGYLWIGLGDGGAAGDRFNNGQNPNTLLGSMLRIDVSGETEYEVPADNPFADGQGGAPEIWAIGLRNPWRYSFDRETGELWLADVGQNAWEEVNHVSSTQPAVNYGWPILEASHCFAQQNCATDNLMMPVTEYTRDQGCSITGGYVYRGSEFPSLQGGYFFSDFCTGLIWAIPAATTDLIEPTVVLESGLAVSSFGEDENGELYVTDLNGGLYRLVSP